MGEQRAHAFFSPSGAAAAMLCPGKPALEELEPESTNAAAERGTLMHHIAARILTGGQVDEFAPELAEDIDAYCTYVRDRVQVYKMAGARNVELRVEQRLSIEEITGERGAEGTTDALIIAEFDDYSDMDVIDAKFGYLNVEAEDSIQLSMYALSAVQRHAMLHSFRQINLIIYQPANGGAKPWPTDLENLGKTAEAVRKAAALSLSLRGNADAVNYLKPGQHQCRFCRVKHRCPALAKDVHAAVFGDFQSIDDPDAQPVLPAEQADATADDLPGRLGLAMQRIPLIEAWIGAVRGAVESRLLAGDLVPGFKLVQGRAGARSWSDESAAEKLLIADGVSPDLMFTPRKLLTAPALEKKLKKAPVWKKVEKFIAAGKAGPPSVAPVDDPREPYTPAGVAGGDFDSYNGEDLV